MTLAELKIKVDNLIENGYGDYRLIFDNLYGLSDIAPYTNKEYEIFGGENLLNII